MFSGFRTAQAQVTSSDQVLFGITFFKNKLIKIDSRDGLRHARHEYRFGSTESGYGLATFNRNLYTFNPNTSSLDKLSKIDGRVLSSTPVWRGRAIW